MSPSGWNGERYETKPRLPGPSAPRAAGRRRFGNSWWGEAWIEALEGRAQLDPNRLPRGRSYARSGAVGPLQLAPGEISAEVQGSRRSPYTVRIRVRQFDQVQWGLVFASLVSEIGHTAALLDGELPPGVAADVRSVGLDLLPGPGEMQPRCSCPDWADPCKHAAAVCYLVADLLDVNPFGVLLLRGRGKEEILAGLRSLRRPVVSVGGSAEATGSDVDEGVIAREAWSRTLGVLPTLPRPPSRPGRPTILAADPPFGLGVDLGVLRGLAVDAAERAVMVAQGDASSGLELTIDEDLARRAAILCSWETGVADSPALTSLARRVGISGHELFCRALAYRDGGRGGLAVLGERWQPAPVQVARGRALLGPGASARGNRVTLRDRQVRLGRDGYWYPFRKDRSGRWQPDGAPLSAQATGGEVGELIDDGNLRGPVE